MDRDESAEAEGQELSGADKIAAQLANVNLGDTVVTHLAKLSHTAIGDDRSIRVMRSASYDPDFRAGLCSLSVESAFGFGALGSGQTVGMAQALAVDLGGETPGSVLSLLQQRHNAPPEGVAISQETWARFLNEMASLTDRSSDCLDQYEKLVFFECADDELLVTPVSSVKLVHEVNDRLHRRNQAFRAARGAARKGAKPGERIDESLLPPRPPRHLLFSHGGANPQNAGYIVNKSVHENKDVVRNTRRGGFNVFLIDRFNGRSEEPWKLMARLGASSSYASIARVNREDQLAFMSRSVIDIDLATHRIKEEEHALQLASQFCEARETLRDAIAALDQLDKVAPWKRLPTNLLCWLDPRIGPFDREALARSFEGYLAGRINNTYTRAQKKRHDGVETNGEAEGDARGRKLLSDRSRLALFNAFMKVL